MHIFFAVFLGGLIGLCLIGLLFIVMSQFAMWNLEEDYHVAITVGALAASSVGAVLSLLGWIFVTPNFEIPLYIMLGVFSGEALLLFYLAHKRRK